ncbi:MAG: FAD-dependent oxidoreductase, partial [Deltaproteobacteria bacterium]
MKQYDIAIIGAGPGGYVAAICAAQAGASVCLVEKERPGGTCLNWGCIPTKALFSSAQLLKKLRHAEEFGVLVDKVAFDFGRAAERKDKVVNQLVGGIGQLLKGNGVDLIRGHGSLEGPGRVKVRCGGVVGHLAARNIIIASGSVPVVPRALAVNGRNILTSKEILAIKELPESLLV